MTIKFSTLSANIFKSLLIMCFLSINYQAISQVNSVNNKILTVSDTCKPTNVKKIIYHFELHEEIMPNAARLVESAIKNAEKANADVIIMEINTYGGRVDIADTIKTQILNAKPLMVAYVVNNAISAGAFITIACDSIYMKKDATIGAITVVNGTDGAQMPDKYQAVMRAKMRSVATIQNRNPDIAEAMVDDRISIPGIIDSGKVITFTSDEALKYDFNDGIVNSVSEVIKALKIDNYKIIEHKVTGVDKIIGFLLNPVVSSILMLLIFGGLYFELQTPGIGFPLAAAVIGATLYFAPLYLEGLAASWEVIVFFIGIALLGVEIFVLPGFGVAGVTALVFIVSSLTLSLVNNDVFDFTFTGVDEIGAALFRVMTTLISGIILMSIFGGSILKSKAFKRMTLQEEQRSDLGYSVRKLELNHLLNLQGITVTDHKTSGKVEIEGTIYNANSEGGWINKGSVVKVLRIEKNVLIVRKLVN